MKVTVKDCLHLAAFHNAKVLSGHENLSNLVKKVTVLDMYTAKEIRQHYVAENQMVLTSFSTIRSNEDAQCKAIKALAEGGNVALVVFYVGEIVQYISDKVVAAAKKEGLPLIELAHDNSLDMGDVINQLSGRLFYEKDQQFTNSLITNTIYHLLNFEKYSSFQSAIKAAAVSNDFQVILLSEDFNPIFSVETRHRTTIAEAIRLGKEKSVEKHSAVYTLIDVNGVLTYWGPVTIQKNKYFMFIVDNEDSYSPGEITKLAEIIELAMGMWMYTPKRDIRVEFIKALQRGNMTLAYSLQGDVLRQDSQIVSVFLLRGELMEEAIRKVDDFQAQTSMQIIKVTEDNETYGLITADVDMEDSKNTCNQLFTSIKEDKTMRIFHVTGLYGIEGAVGGYRLISEAWPFVQVVFPYKRVFTKYELALVSNCINIRLQGGLVKKNYLDFLEPFDQAGDNKGKQLLETLETFVLDAGMNSGKTAEIMNVHTNTVQYRLKKINQVLGVEITGNRVIPGLTIALALKRLDVAGV